MSFQPVRKSFLTLSLFRYQPSYETKTFLANGRSYSFSSESKTNKKLQQEKSCITKTFWSPRVVFGGSDNMKCTIDQGSIVVNVQNGIIESCHPGESRDESRAKRGTTTTFVDLSSSIKSSDSCCLSPGLIDVHTHISSLGRNWEGYTTATQAAAAGGITTIIGMPLNSLPPTCSVEVVEQELALANQSSSELFIDVGLWGGVLPETVSSLQTNNNDNHPLSELLAHPHVLGLKAFLSPLPPGAGYQAVTREQLLRVSQLCGSFEKPILVHSELMTQEELEQSMQSAFPGDGSRDNSYDAHVKSRPVEWEQNAIQLVIDCTKYCDMHIVHLSDALGCLPLIKTAKSQNKKLTVETCPHYLLLDTHQIKDGDVRVKCFPPIREPEQREELWDGLSSGLIDMIASDHSPCEPSMRAQHSIRTAWGGLTGLQYQLQATWTASKKVANDKNSSCFFFDEADIARWWSINPAKLAGLHHDRGSIEPGKQADFVFWNPNYLDKPKNYTREYHRWKGDCYYSTQELFGRVLSTWKSGIQVYDGINDKLLKSNGKYIKKNEGYVQSY